MSLTPCKAPMVVCVGGRYFPRLHTHTGRRLQRRRERRKYELGRSGTRTERRQTIYARTSILKTKPTTSKNRAPRSARFHYRRFKIRRGDIVKDDAPAQPPMELSTAPPKNVRTPQLRRITRQGRRRKSAKKKELARRLRKGVDVRRGKLQARREQSGSTNKQA